MKVLTLNKTLLNSKSCELAQEVLSSSWQAELIIGIKTGGIYVAEPLHVEISKKYNTLYNRLSLSRPSTLKKKKFKVEKILRKMPYFLLNILRNIEVFIFEVSKKESYSDHREKDILIDEKIHKEINSCKNILLVDDAIDTGTTILAIKNRLLEINSNADIKVAVLTTTHLKPFIEADFSLYKRVLLRCPWSQDYKEED